MLLLIVVGFLSLLSQVVLLRELNVASYGVELVYPLGLAAWLFWTAAGALIHHRLLRPSSTGVACLLILLAVVLPLDVAFLRYSRILAAGVPGAYLPLLHQLAILAASLLPVGLLLGLLFQWAARLFIAGRRTLALAYSVESAGAVVGGLAATLLLAAGVQNFTTTLACSIVSALAALCVPRPGRILLQGAAALTVLGLIGVLVRAGQIDRAMTSWNHSGLLASRDSPYGRVTVTRLEEQLSVFENDALVFDTQGTAAEEFTHLAALQHPGPRNILVLGSGISGIVGEALEHGPSKLRTVELNRVLMETASPHLPEDLRAPLRSPAVEETFADPRKFLRNASGFDLILVAMPDPSSGQANRFYTREFFALCRRCLDPDGIVAFRLASAENLLTPPMERRLASICCAARASFTELLALPLPGNTIVFLASQRGLSRDPRLLEQRFEERGITARLVSPPYLEYVITNDRLEPINNQALRDDVPANTDSQPICYQYTILNWLSRFVPSAALVDVTTSLREASRSMAVWGALLAVIPGLFILARLRPGLRRALLAATAGFVGMILESVLILHYQMKSGVLYQDIGFLLMVFMVGLAAGALTIDRLGSRQRRSGPGEGARGIGQRRGECAGRSLPRRWGVLLVCGCALLAAGVAAAVDSGLLAGLPGCSAGLAAAGFFVGGIFAYASLHGIEDQEAVVSPLYAADLAGGCVAAVAGTLVAIPALGLTASTAGTAALAAAAILLL